MLNCASCLFLLLLGGPSAVGALCASPFKLPLRVYIEDTDAYGVVYWANYLRFFERAAVAALGPQLIGNLAHGHCGSTPQIFGMQRAHGMKYSVPATMGDACTVELTPLGLDAKGSLAVKAALVRDHDGVELCSAADCRFGFVAAQTGMPCEVWPLEESDSFERLDEPVTPRLDEESAPPAAELSPSLEPAELHLALDEAGGASAGLSIHAAARYFERHRTTFLGGPAGLQGLADEYELNVVVGRVNNFHLLPAAQVTTRVGTPLELRCHAKAKARATQVVFEQWLCHGETLAPLARAEVLCLALSRDTGRIVPFPAKIVEELKQWEASAAPSAAQQ